MSQLACGGMHSLAVDLQDRVLAWGMHQNGVLGVGRDHPAESIRTPTAVPEHHANQVAEQCL